jgi:hypothetical protein
LAKWIVVPGPPGWEPIRGLQRFKIRAQVSQPAADYTEFNALLFEFEMPGKSGPRFPVALYKQKPETVFLNFKKLRNSVPSPYRLFYVLNKLF